MAASDLPSLSEGMSTLTTAEDAQLAVSQAEELITQVLKGAKTMYAVHESIVDASSMTALSC